MAKKVKVDKEKEKEYTEKYKKWRAANVKKPSGTVTFDTKASREKTEQTVKTQPKTLQETKAHVKAMNEVAKQTPTYKLKQQQTIKNAAESYKFGRDIRPQLTRASSAKEQAQIANEAVADVYRGWAKDPRKVVNTIAKPVSPKALKAGAEQGVANLVQGTKAGAFSTAIDLGRAGIAESNPYAAVVEAMGRVRPGNNTEIMAMQNAAYSQIQRQNAEKMAATQRAIANKYGPLNKGEQFVSDIISNAIPMLPAIATGAVTGGAGSMPVIATYARGLGEMQALNEGTSLDKARLYGLGTAALETGTEMMFGGIAGLPGGGLLGKAKGLVGDVAESAELLGKTANRARALERAIGNVDDALHVTNKIKAPTLQRAARATGKVAGEGIEEVVAEALDPALQRATYNPNAENATLGQLAYAGALGSVTAGLMNAGAVGAQRIARVPGDIQNASRESADAALFGQNTADRMAAQEAARQQNAQQQAAEADQNAAQQGQDNNTNPDNPAQQNPANAAGNLPGQAQNGNPEQQTNAPQENATQPAIRPPQLQRPTLEMQERTFDNVASKNVKAYQQENLAVKPYYQATADQLLSDLQQGIKGGRDVGVNPETRNVTGRGAWKRQQSEPIERMLSDGMTYAQIEDGLQRLVEDNGKENTANAKRAELYVDDAVRKGYDSIVSGNVPANRAFAYHGMSEAELQERLQQLENSFTPDMSEAEAQELVAEMNTITELLTPEPTPAQQMVDYYDLDKLPADVREFYEHVGESDGVSRFNVRIVSGLPQHVNGKNDGHGNILLNGDNLTSVETISKVLSHEIYHSIRATDEHKEIQDCVWELYKAQHPGVTQEDMLNPIISLHQRLAEMTGDPSFLVDKDGAWDEIGAEFIETALTDPKLAKRIYTDNPSLFQRIAWAIEDMLQRYKARKLTGVERTRYDMLQKARELYAEGLHSMQYQGGTQSGENGGTRYMFAGERSQTADREALEQAKQMAAHGVDMETIRQQTGWFRSNVTGGKWAYEIDDSGATINSNKDAYALEDYYNHPELYRAYPQLRDIYLNRMSQQELGAGVLGRYSGSQIDYSNNEVIPHEVQHAVQDIEGFPKGSNPRYWQRKLDNEEISLEQFPRYKTAEAEKRRMFESFPNDIKEKIREINRLYLTNDDANIDKALALEQEIYDSEWGDNYAAYDMADFEMRSVHARLHSGDLNAEDLYRNTAGEIMARDTKARRDLTAEQRRQKQPQMGNSDTVYAERGGSSYSKKMGGYFPDNEVSTADVAAYGIRNFNNEKEVFQKVREKLKEDYLSTPAQSKPIINIDTGIAIEIRQGGISETFNKPEYYKNLSYDEKLAKVASMSKLANLIKYGEIRAEEAGNYHNPNSKVRYAYLEAPLKVDGMPYIVRMDIRRSPNGENRFYIHSLKMKKMSNSLAAFNQESRSSQKMSRLGENQTSFIDASIPQADQDVNDESAVRYSLNNDRYQEILDQYGAMPPGENPTGNNRDIQVPKSTDGQNKVRQFDRNAMESNQTADETVEILKKNLDTYTPTSNKKLLNEADDIIMASGSWRSAADSFQTEYRAGKRMTAVDIAIGERCIQAAQEEGDYATAAKLIGDVAALGTELGQAVQALRLLKRLTPENRLLTLKRVQQRINADLQRRAKAKQREKGDYPQVELSAETERRILEARGSKEQEEAWDAAIKEMGEQVPATLADKVNAYRYLSMLGNIRTHLRNLIGNTVMRTVMGVQHLTQATGETMFIRNGERHRSFKASKELKEFARWDYEHNAKRMLQSTGSRYNDAASMIRQQQRVFKTKLPETLRKANSDLLEAEDLFFKRSAYIDAMAHYMAANKMAPSIFQKATTKATYEQAQVYAIQQAQRATFQEMNWLANELSRIENKNMLSKLAVGGLMPFKRTPLNIAKRGALEYSPIGIARALKKMRFDVKNGDATPTEALENLTEGLVGTAIMTLGYFMMSWGLLSTTGDDDDKRKARFDSQMGSQDYAFVFPDGSTYTIDWLSPSVMPLLVGAEIYRQRELAGDEDENFVIRGAEALTRISDPLLEMSCMQSLTDALSSYSSDSSDIISSIGGSAIKSYGGQFVPTLAKQAARTIDDTVRSSYAPKKMQIDDGSSIMPQGVYWKPVESFVRQQRSGIPLASMYNDPSIDVWGNERKREFSGNELGNIALRALNTFINPGNYSSDKRTTLDRELEKLQQSTGNSLVLPKTAQSTINETKQNPQIYLTPHEYSRFATTQGKKSQQYVSDFVNSSTYKNLDDDTKAEIVSDLYSLAAYQARKEALKGRGYKDYSVDIYEDALASGVKPYSYYATKARFGGKWADYDVVSKYAEAADKIGLSDKAFTSHYDAMNSVEGGKGKKDRKIAYLDQQKNAGKITNEQYWYLRINFAGNPSKTEKASCPYRWMVE